MSKNDVHISVALTTFNGEKYIENLLKSLINQTRKIDEIVIFDDNSTDNTVKIIDAFINIYSMSNIILYRNSINVGWRMNFRKALEKCNGDFVFLCDQDDVWYDNKIEDMVGIMERKEDIQLLVSNLDIIEEEKLGKHQHLLGNTGDDGKIEKLHNDKWFFCVIRPGCTFCLRKSLYLDLIKMDDETIDHDSAIWALAMMKGNLWLLRKRLMLFRRHENSATTKDSYLGIQNVINNIDNTLKTISWAKQYSCKFIFDDKLIHRFDSISSFLMQRKKILLSGSILQMLYFGIRYVKFYPSVKNMCGDILVKVCGK